MNPPTPNVVAALPPHIARDPAVAPTAASIWALIQTGGANLLLPVLIHTIAHILISSYKGRLEALEAEVKPIIDNALNTEERETLTEMFDVLFPPANPPLPAGMSDQP